MQVERNPKTYCRRDHGAAYQHGGDELAGLRYPERGREGKNVSLHLDDVLELSLLAGRVVRCSYKMTASRWYRQRSVVAAVNVLSNRREHRSVSSRLRVAHSG
jgi:hypothetical protein